jgi:hypothetical protein
MIAVKLVIDFFIVSMSHIAQTQFWLSLAVHPHTSFQSRQTASHNATDLPAVEII